MTSSSKAKTARPNPTAHVLGHRNRATEPSDRRARSPKTPDRTQHPPTSPSEKRATEPNDRQARTRESRDRTQPPKWLGFANHCVSTSYDSGPKVGQAFEPDRIRPSG